MDNRWVNVGFDWTQRVKRISIDTFWLRMELGVEMGDPKAVWGWCRERIEGMPADAAPRAVTVSTEHGGILVFVQSASFPEVPWNQKPPDVVLEVRRDADGYPRWRWPSDG